MTHETPKLTFTRRVQDNSAQNQLGPCQLGPHKNRPMPTRPKMQNSAHTNSAQFKFYKRQLVPHFSGIEVCVFYHLLTARFAPRIKYPYPFMAWLTAQSQTTSHKLPYLIRSHAFIVSNNYIVLTTIIYLFLKLSTVTVRRNQPARNPREGMLQTLKKKNTPHVQMSIRVNSQPNWSEHTNSFFFSKDRLGTTEQ